MYYLYIIYTYICLRCPSTLSLYKIMFITYQGQTKLTFSIKLHKNNNNTKQITD